MGKLSEMKKPQIKTSLPGPKSLELQKIKEKYIPLSLCNFNPSFIKRAEGAVIEDIDGNIFIDFASGISVMNVGYSNPEIIEAVKDQADKYFHLMFNVLPYESYVQLAKKMCEITPGDHTKKTAFFNSGAEAIENAVKIARTYTKKQDVITFEGGFHGRTLLTMAMNSKMKPYGFGFGPYPSGIHKIPFAYCFRCPYGLKEDNCNYRCAERLNEILNSVTIPEQTAAVVLEPIQGEGGFIVPPNGFIKRIREICTENNILLIADEIQSGFCRSGKMFACSYWQEYGVIPDLMTSAKSIAAGLPISTVVGREEIMDSVHKSGIGGTFGGNPLSCVASLKTIEIMERDNYAEKSQKLGKLLKEQLVLLQKKYQIIGDVRGSGSMIGLEFVKSPDKREPAPEYKNIFQKKAYENGLIFLGAGLYDNVIRFVPPLVMVKEQLMYSLEIVDKVLSEISNE